MLAGRHARMQFSDEGAVAIVLRRHQRHRLPVRRDDPDAPAIPVPDVGAEAMRLHRGRPVRQANADDVAIRPHARASRDLPGEALVGQLELVRRSDQRRLEGVARLDVSFGRSVGMFGVHRARAQRKATGDGASAVRTACRPPPSRSARDAASACSAAVVSSRSLTA